MPINRRMNENVVHTYNGVLLSHQCNEIVPFSEMRMDLETVIQSEVSQKEKQILYNIANMWNLEKQYK